MRAFLINKNLCLLWWLRSRIGRQKAKAVCMVIEKVIKYK